MSSRDNHQPISMRTRSKSRDYRRRCDESRSRNEKTPSPPVPKLPSKRRGRRRSQSQPNIAITAVETVPAEPETERETLRRENEVRPTVPATGLSVPNVGKRSVSPGEGVRPNKAFNLRVAARPKK